jgi:membrane protease YdiL (CAAX protease family)
MAGQKREKKGYTRSQLLNFTRDSYLERTSRPFYAIVFLLPFILFYEFGTALINTDVLNQHQVRVVAFVWLQNALERLGTGDRLAWIAPPLFVIVILAGLQITSQRQWYFCFGDYAPMLVECICLAVPLLVLSLLFNSPLAGSGSALRSSRVDPPAHMAAVAPQEACAGQDMGEPESPGEPRPTSRSAMTDIVTGVGAGIYEELVFRLILVCALMVMFQDVIGLSHQNAIVLSIMVSAALFSAHHNVIFVDGHLVRSAPFDWMEFGFRTIAGVYFAILFAIRGFGVTAGTHASYDIIATVVNVVFFAR